MKVYCMVIVFCMQEYNYRKNEKLRQSSKYCSESESERDEFVDPIVDEVYRGVNTELVEKNPDKIFVQFEASTEHHHSDTSYDRF